MNKVAFPANVLLLLMFCGTVRARENPYQALYRQSVEQMQTPDALPDPGLSSFDDPGNRFLLAAANSKTCSQRCSTSCSKSCTTTRGCSSQCKVKTDGCGGGGTTSGSRGVVLPSDSIPPRSERTRRTATPKSDADTSRPAATKPTVELPPPFTAKVVDVVSGDTIIVLKDDGEKAVVRLAAMDAPEQGQLRNNESTQALGKLVLGNQITVKPTRIEKNDLVVGQVHTDDLWVNEKMVADGWAWYYETYATDSSLAKKELAARKAIAGIWADSSPVAPWVYRLAHPSTEVEQDSEALRVWTDASGNFTIKARFRSVDGGQVVLEREDGKTISVPIDELSQADRTYLSRRK